MRTVIHSRIVAITLGLAVVFGGVAEAGLDVWTSNGPFGGKINALVIDPQSPSTLYVGTPVGVFKSTDGGGQWMAVNQGLSDLDIQALAIDPQTPATLYAATFFEGIFKTTDGGSQWVAVNGGLFDFDRNHKTSPPSPDVRTLAIDPQTPTTIYAGRFGLGIFKSVDGGGHWSAVNVGLPEGALVEVLAIDPLTPATVYAGTFPFVGTAEVFKSTDGGSHWTSVSEGLGEGQVVSLAIDPQTPTILYAGTAQTSFSGPGGQVYKSLDGGAHWSATGSEFDGGVVESLAIDPQTPSTLFAGRFGAIAGVFKSVDSGASWTEVSHGLINPLTAIVAIDPLTPSTLYVGGVGGGVSKSINSGSLWAVANEGLANGRVRALVIDPQTPTTLYAGTQAGAFRSTDGGEHWVAASAGLADSRVLALAIDPETPSTLYAGTAGKIYKSLNGGNHWSALSGGLPGHSFQALAVDPQQPTTLYAGTFDPESGGGGIFRTMDSGDTWTAINEGLAFGSDQIWALAIDPATPSTLYAGAFRGIYKSTDSGDHWELFIEGLTNQPDSARVESLLVDPRNPSTVYAGLDGGLDIGGAFKSTDGGEHWFEVNNGLENFTTVETIAIDGSGTLYIGTNEDSQADNETVVFKSTDGGNQWLPLNDGLQDLPVYALAIDPATPSTVYAGSFGGGVWDLRQVSNQQDMMLQNGRFRVEVQWRDFEGLTGPGKVAVVPTETEDGALLASRDSAVAQFFDRANWEMLVKVLDGRVINNHFWVFQAAATNVEVTTTVTDTSCGNVQIYTNPLGVAAPALNDTLAFQDCENPLPPNCVVDDETFCLGEGGRFQVDIEWRDFDDGFGTGSEVSIPRAGLAKSDDSGLFYFFSEDNWELLVKVLDGCDINDNFWVFAAASTDVEYTVTVTDTLTDEVKTYANPLGQAADAITDINAFQTCP